MDGKELAHIRNSLSMLPEQKNRLQKLKERIYKAEQNLKELLDKFNEERYDVERLKQDSLSVTLLKLIGKYEGKLHKEMQEAIVAKLNYDKANNMVTELKNESEEISRKITELEKKKSQYEEELKNRERMLMDNINDETAIKYKKLEAERDSMAKQLLETKEAIRAANKVKGSANEAIKQLKDAKDWAAYDTITKGGIFSHMAKYEHIDNAQLAFNKLTAQLKELNKELSDINLVDKLEITEIDSIARALDFWFDNIFTDLNILDKIESDIERLKKLISKVEDIIERLEDDCITINKNFDNIENKKNDLLIFDI